MPVHHGAHHTAYISAGFLYSSAITICIPQWREALSKSPVQQHKAMTQIENSPGPIDPESKN